MSRRRGIGFCMPGYRWCGPGCGGSGPPTNQVDSCCMRHDLCYQRYGPSRECDLAFMECLRQQRNRYTKEGRDAAFFYNVMRLRTLFRL
jgi:hypothetical protein|nr:Parvovirus coat protein VP1-like protein [Fredinandcohnia onubensis]